MLWKPNGIMRPFIVCSHTVKWSIDQAGLKVFDLLTTGKQTVFISADDTLLPRRGLKVFGTGMHRDPVLSSRSHHVTRWGHC